MNESTNATASSSTAPGTPTPANTENYAQVVKALGNLLKAQTGETASNEKISQLLLQNMAQLVHSGAVTKQQIIQLKEFADQHRPPGSQPAPAMLTNQTPQKPAPPPPVSGTHHGALKAADSASQLPNLAATSVEFYPTINSTLNTVNPGPVPWPQTRPTLTGGVVGGRISGTPAQVARPSDDPSILTADDSRTRRKSTPGDQSMRRTIQDLVASVDPNVKIEPEVEDLLLSIADEFIDSVTNFSCRLAKHRGGETLEVRDLQLHLERNHNIRIPGFASDETRYSLSQSTAAPAFAATTGKKNAQGTHTTLRSQRLAQVQQAKREAKLM